MIQDRMVSCGPVKPSPTEGDGNMGSGVNGLHGTVPGHGLMGRLPTGTMQGAASCQGETGGTPFSLSWKEGGEGECGLEKEGWQFEIIFPDCLQLLKVSRVFCLGS